MTVHGNGGNLTTNMKTHIKNYGDVWFHPDAITNILSLKNVKSKFPVTYDSEGEGTFIVHKPDGVNVHFIAHADGLHYLNRKVRVLYPPVIVSTTSELMAVSTSDDHLTPNACCAARFQAIEDSFLSSSSFDSILFLCVALEGRCVCARLAKEQRLRRRCEASL